MTTNFMLKATLILASSAFSAACAGTLTLQDVMSRAVANNGMAVSSRFMEKSARANANSVGRFSDPMLMFGIENLPTSGDFKEDPMTMRSVGLSWTIPYSGENRLLRMSARIESDAIGHNRRLEELAVARIAGFQFAEVLFLQNELTLMKKQLELANLVLTTANSRHISGIGSEDEVVMAQNEVWRMQSQVSLSEQMVRDEVRMLAAMIASDVALDSLATLQPIVIDSIPRNAEEWVQTAESSNPRLKQLSTRIESSRLSAGASGRMKWPMLTLGAEYGFRSGVETGLHGEEGERGDMMSFRADISLPIFSRKRNSDMQSSMQSMMSAYQSDSAQVSRELRAQIRSLHERSRVLLEQVRVHRVRIVPSGNDLIRIGMRGYSAGTVMISPVLSHVQSSIGDQITLARLEKELTQTLLSARDLMGTLIPEGDTTGKQ